MSQPLTRQRPRVLFPQLLQEANRGPGIELPSNSIHSNGRQLSQTHRRIIAGFSPCRGSCLDSTRAGSPFNTHFPRSVRVGPEVGLIGKEYPGSECAQPHPSVQRTPPRKPPAWPHQLYADASWGAMKANPSPGAGSSATAAAQADAKFRSGQTAAPPSNTSWPILCPPRRAVLAPHLSTPPCRCLVKGGGERTGLLEYPGCRPSLAEGRRPPAWVWEVW